MHRRRDVPALVAAIVLVFALGQCEASGDAVSDAVAGADAIDLRGPLDVEATDRGPTENEVADVGTEEAEVDVAREVGTIDHEPDVCPCGTPCETDADCDDGNPCTVESCDGTWGYCSNLGEGEWIDCGPGRTCDPATGECRDDCVLGTSVPCSRQNAFGTCQGARVCEPAGLADCDAPEPAKEQCDCLDNDCDGTTDEGFPDSNADGVPDCLGDWPCTDNVDDDGDGVPDDFDNCPKVPNPDQANWDLEHPCGCFDDLGDACDPDDDNDGVDDPDDCEPKNCLIFPVATELCDGKDNNCNGLVDEGLANTDGDALADCVDPDIDNDSILNELDNCPTVYNPAQTDSDGDGVGDACM